jgi:transposase
MKKEDFVYDIEKHEMFFYGHLSESKKRQFAGLEAMKMGYNGVSKIAKKFKIHKHTVRKGKQELIEQTVPPEGKIRQKGGGRKKRLS